MISNIPPGCKEGAHIDSLSVSEENEGNSMEAGTIEGNRLQIRNYLLARIETLSVLNIRYQPMKDLWTTKNCTLLVCCFGNATFQIQHEHRCESATLPTLDRNFWFLGTERRTDKVPEIHRVFLAIVDLNVLHVVEINTLAKQISENIEVMSDLNGVVVHRFDVNKH